MGVTKKTILKCDSCGKRVEGSNPASVIASKEKWRVLRTESNKKIYLCRECRKPFAEFLSGERGKE